MRTFASRVAGIPCLIHVEWVEQVAGSFHHDAPSDLDYTGYTESVWSVRDRRGYPAPWLEKKLTPKDENRIESEVGAHVSQ